MKKLLLIGLGSGAVLLSLGLFLLYGAGLIVALDFLFHLNIGLSVKSILAGAVLVIAARGK